LLKEKGHYVQAINYPTVPIGQEKLRMAPTPHHTIEMIDTFIEDMLDVWAKLGIPIKTVSNPDCSHVVELAVVVFEMMTHACFVRTLQFVCIFKRFFLSFSDSLQHVQQRLSVFQIRQSRIKLL